VISPLFIEGTYMTDYAASQKAYCNTASNMFNNWSDIDRQTELSDDDGSLTGYAKTVSVNVDPFFKAPVEAYECASDATVIPVGAGYQTVAGTAKTSPYDYVTTVVYPEVGFQDTLPTGLTTVGGNTGTCGGVVVSPGVISMSTGVGIQPGGCTIVVQVTASTAGTYTNTSGMLQTTLGNAPSASAQLTVAGGGPRSPLPPASAPRRLTAAATPPTLSMAFSPTTIAPGGTATLTITMTNPNPVDPPMLLTVPQWTRECSDQQCYGVPMYRQSLVKAETATTGPIRLAGQNSYNRSTLTPNNGVFYIDTTVSNTKQRATGQIWTNVFQKSSHYYLFMLFAQQKTEQVYQFYVGKPFDANTDVWATRANTKAIPVTFSAPNSLAWPSGWGRSYNSTTGVLTVTMNMGFPGFADDYNKSFKDNCQPPSFCKWDTNRTDPLHPERGGSCTCNPAGPFATVCQDTNTAKEDVCAWSQKDVDCPSGGCWGIGFKTGDTFDYDQVASPRPAQACFPNNAKWNVTYVDAAPGLAGAAPICTNAPKLPLNFCGN